MISRAADVIDKLAGSRSIALLRLLDGARLDSPVEPEPDPATVVEPYRWLLTRIGDGIKLTQAGYLPPAVVTEAMSELGWQDRWWGKHNREDQTQPLLELRQAAQRFGLVRKYRGVLQVTKLGRTLIENPDALWWHIADRMPEAGSEPERHAGVLYLLTVAAGRPRDDALLAEGMWALGWAGRDSYLPLSETAAFMAARPTWAVLRTLELFGREDLLTRSHEAPPSAAVRLARAALLGSEPVTVQPQVPRAERLVELVVTLRDTEPPIWRRLRVGSALTLAQLHRVLQVAMGWQDYHLHSFDINGVRYGDVEDMPGPLGDEMVRTIGEVAAEAIEFSYEYDFGDGWEHTIAVTRLAEVGGGAPELIAGERACPPEDCGGPGGYADLLSVLADPSGSEHANLLDWLDGGFDPESLDVDRVNADLGLVHRNARRHPTH